MAAHMDLVNPSDVGLYHHLSAAVSSRVNALVELSVLGHLAFDFRFSESSLSGADAKQVARTPKFIWGNH